MLLDKYVLTKSFENLLSYHNKPTTTISTPTTPTAPPPPPAGFVRRVNQAMTRIDPLLKTLQVRPSPPEGLVQAYLIHIGDRSDTNFKKILELKGVRRQDHSHLMELFAIHRESFGSISQGGGGKQLVQNSPLLTPLMAGSSSVLGSSSTGMNTAGGGSVVPGLQGRVGTGFDAASLGEKLLNAARDGVLERVGGPSSGNTGVGTAGGDGVAGGGDKATINDNLKNIGKFFRRDIGGLGLGARFGKRDVTPTGGGHGVE